MLEKPSPEIQRDIPNPSGNKKKAPLSERILERLRKIRKPDFVSNIIRGDPPSIPPKVTH